MAASATRIFQTMKEASPLIYATFLDIAAKKLLEEQGISSGIFNASNAEFLAWLKSIVSLETLNQVILERNVLPQGVTQSDYSEFANRPDRDKIVNSLLNDPAKRHVFQVPTENSAAAAEVAKYTRETLCATFANEFKLDLETAQKIMAICASGNTSYIAPISDRQYQEWLEESIKPAIPTIKNDIYYLTAQKEIDHLAANIDPASPLAELKKGIAKIIRVIELATYTLSPSLWNKDIQFVAANASKTNTLPPLLHEYYVMLTALYRNEEQDPTKFILTFNEKVGPFLGKFLQQKREEENSLFSKYNLSNHYTWHLRALDFLLSIPRLAYRASALSEKRKSGILNDGKEAELALDFSAGDEEEFLDKLITHLMDKLSLSREEAEKRARKAFADSEVEETQKESMSLMDGSLSSSSSAPPPPAPPPLPPAARFRLKAANTLKRALGSGDSKELDELVNSMIGRGVKKEDIKAAQSKMEKKKETASKVQRIPDATKYGPLEIPRVQEQAIVHIFSHLPPQEEWEKLENGYLLVKDLKLVKTKLYYLNSDGLVECRPDAQSKLQALCMHLDQFLDKDQLLKQLTTFFMSAPFNLAEAEAEKRARIVLEESEKENDVIEASSSSSLPEATPVSAEARFKARLKNSLKSNIESDVKEPKAASSLIDAFMPTAGLKCVTLDAKQHRDLILTKCGGHNYKKAAENAAAMLVAESSLLSAQGPMITPAPMVASVERRPSLGVSQGAPVQMGSVERKPSLGFAQGAPAKKYNFEGYEVALLKAGENLPEDAAIHEKMLYAKWDSNKKELAVKFKQGEAAPISFSMNISMSDRIKLLTEALEKPESTDWEKVNSFIKFRTEDPDMGQRNSVAFRRPPQVLEQGGRRSVSPEKAKEPVEDGSKEKGKEDAAGNPRIVSAASPLSFLPPVEEKKEATSDSPKEKGTLSASPKISFMPPPMTEEKEALTPTEGTQNEVSGIGLRSSQE